MDDINDDLTKPSGLFRQRAALQNENQKRCFENFDRIKTKLISRESIDLQKKILFYKQDELKKRTRQEITLNQLIEDFNSIHDITAWPFFGHADITVFTEAELQSLMAKACKILRRLLLEAADCNEYEKHDSGRYQLDDHDDAAECSWVNVYETSSVKGKAIKKYNKFNYKMVISKQKYETTAEFLGLLAHQVSHEVHAHKFNQFHDDVHDDHWAQVYFELVIRSQMVGLKLEPNFYGHKKSDLLLSECKKENPVFIANKNNETAMPEDEADEQCGAQSGPVQFEKQQPNEDLLRLSDSPSRKRSGRDDNSSNKRSKH